MNWEDLNKDNIEAVKDLYIEYLEDNKKYNYISCLKTFEEFMKLELKKCDRCGIVILNEKDLCDCCYDEMFKI